ncbi:hypothetical protein PHMEG_00028461 [Phytophthora megakarya]|uniref:Uncharacterized protein n=1 Tax=Phytophthora megakarya TaxID=4795 RepID=A0A225V4W0_9STRA|nr:hypothetical protein PHMEG_00028461 [Phytophthora megakarya]
MVPQHRLPRLHRVTIPQLLLLHLPSLRAVVQVVVLRGGSPIQLNPPLFPAEASVPLYSDVKVFTAAEINPWDPLVVGPVPILVMIQATLTKRMPIPTNFLFPHRIPPVRAPQPVVGYCSGLITGANTPLWRIAVAYAALEEDHMIAYWESTHYLEITAAMAKADADLFTYHADRRL